MIDNAEQTERSCDIARRALQEALDSGDSSTTVSGVEDHLVECEACREFGHDLRLLREAVQTMPPIPLPDEVVARVWSRTIDAPSVSAGRYPELRRLCRRWSMAGAAAAALALAVGVMNLAPDRAGPTQAEVDRATDQTMYVLTLASATLRQVGHTTVTDVLEGRIGSALRRASTELSNLPVTLLFRSSGI